MADRTIRIFLWLTVMRGCGQAVFASSYVLFLQSLGLNFLQVNLVNTIYFVTMVLAEVPTGVIADVYGRRVSCIIAGLVMGLGFSLYALADSMWMCMIGEGIAAIGATCITGAFSSWMVDSIIHHEGDGARVQQVIARSYRWSIGSQLLAGIAGGYMVSYVGYSSVWLIAGLFHFAFAVIAWRGMDEPYRAHQPRATCRETVTIAAHVVRNRPALWILMATTVALVMVTQGPNMHWQPLFGQYLSPVMLGYVYAGVKASIFAGILLASRGSVQRLASPRMLALVTVGICLLVIATVGSSGLVIMLVCYMGHEVLRGVYSPLNEACLHRCIPSSRQRATVISVDAMLAHAGGVVGLVAVGALADAAGIEWAWIVIAVPMAALCVLLALPRSSQA